VSHPFTHYALRFPIHDQRSTTNDQRFQAILLDKNLLFLTRLINLRSGEKLKPMKKSINPGTWRWLSILFLMLSGSIYAQTPKLVYDINPGSSGSSANDFAVFNGKLYFQADDGTHGIELWVYDGTSKPSMVADINSGSGWSDPRVLTVYKNKLYFQADDGTHGRELWVYDGTNNPKMVYDIYSGSSGGLDGFYPSMMVFNDTLYFTADDGTHGGELWKYDGVNNPKMVADINSGSSGSIPQYFAVYHNALYFEGDDGKNGSELYKYDGTAAPALAADIQSGSGSSTPTFLTVFNGLLYFAADDGNKGSELWQYDYSTGKAKIAADINSGIGGSLPQYLTVYKNQLYFSADDAVDGAELWTYTSSGSASMVYDIYPGNFNASFPANFCVYNDTLYFSANDGTYGMELWKYGGGGTPKMVADIYAGSYGSFPTDPVVYKNTMYFGADDSTHNMELWKLAVPCKPVTSTFTITACDSFKWINKVTYYADNNTAKDTLVSSTGCDSIVTLNLTIKKSVKNDLYVTACRSYNWLGVDLTSSFTYSKKFTGHNGCDSIVYLHLKINQPTSSAEYVITCGSYTWWGTTYTSSTTAHHIIPNSVGCDSDITLNLAITTPPTRDTFAKACDRFTWYGNTYTSSTTATQVLKSNNGCDTTVTLHLTIGHPESTDFNYVTCEPVTVNGKTYTESGQYTQRLTSSCGCDSILNIHYLKKFPKDTASEVACTSFSMNGKTYTKSGFYNATIGTCDPIILNLTILKPDTTVISLTSCDNYTLNGTSYFKSGTYFQKFKNKGGCDSIVVLQLIIHKNYMSIDKHFSCGPYTWIDGKTYTTSTQSAYKTYKTSTGCDSIIYLDLTIGTPNSAYIHITNCNPVTINGQLYGTTGAYTQHLTNKAGCDSILVVDYFKIIKDSTINVDTCNSYTLNGTTYTSSGTYTQNIVGCPGKITLNLKIRKGTASTTKITACKTYTWNGDTYTTSGTYSKSFTNAAGCDSTATLNLTIANGSTSSTDITACATKPYTWLGHTYSTSGTYMDTVKDVNGCDSIAKLNLSLSSILRLGQDIPVPGERYNEEVPCFSRDGNTMAILSNTDYGLSPVLSMYSWDGTNWQQKATKTIAFNFDPATVIFSDTYISLSKDGKTVAVSADAHGDNNIYGATYLFSFDGSNLSPKGNVLAGDGTTTTFGGPISLSADGNAIGIGNYNGRYTYSGTVTAAIKVLYYDAGTWKEKGKPVFNQAEIGELAMGTSISLSDDGNTVAIGGVSLNFYGRGIDTNARVFQWDGTAWSQKGNTFTGLCKFIYNSELSYCDVNLSADGSILVLGNPTKDDGSVNIFKWANNQWVKRYSIQNPAGEHSMGSMVVLSDDGNNLLTFAYGSGQNYYSGKLHFYKWNGNSYIDTLKINGYNHSQYMNHIALSGNGKRYGYSFYNDAKGLITASAFEFCGNGSGIDEPKGNIPGYDDHFAVYPNPNNGFFTIKNPAGLLNKQNQDAQYMIYNMQGKMIQQGRLDKPENTVSIADAPPGIYLIRMQIGTAPGYSTMLIKQ
jgi:ELWxxDGT repeat protein